MGYYTTFSLQVIVNKEDLESSTEFFYDTSFEDYSMNLVEKFVELYQVEHAINHDGSANDSTKWYEHDENLLEFSQQYPKAVFKLTGEGEESQDLWVKYYKNGKMQRCQAIISFEEYDESKLI